MRIIGVASWHRLERDEKGIERERRVEKKRERKNEKDKKKNKK